MTTGIDVAISLIKKWEGCKLVAYRPLSGDVWTIGYGATGPDITQNTRWTQEQADADLYNRVNNLYRQLKSHITYGTFANELGACLSIAYNIGAQAFIDSTLLRKLNEGDLQGAADEFLRWDHFHGEVVQGLLNRRKDERAVFLGPHNTEGTDV